MKFDEMILIIVNGFIEVHRKVWLVTKLEGTTNERKVSKERVKTSQWKSTNKELTIFATFIVGNY